MTIDRKIAEIIPLRKIQRKLDIFDYIIPPDLEDRIKTGCLVEIEFQKTVVQGLVINVKEESDIPVEKLKPLFKLLLEKPVLTKKYIELILKLSKYYFVSPSIFFTTFLPEIPKKEHKNLKIEQKEPKQTTSTENKTQPILFHYFKKQEKYSFYLETIKKNLEKEKQTLIIFPEIADLDEFLPIVSEFQNNLVIFENKSMHQYLEQWLDVTNNNKKIIVGTRSAIFSPLANPGTIIIDQEQDPSHKQEEPNPRYSTKIIAYYLSLLYNCQTVYTSFAPSIELYYKATQQNFNYLKSEILIPEIKINDLNNESKKGNYSPLAENILEMLKTSFQNKQKTFLFSVKKGFGKIVQCSDCGHTFTCPTCKTPLAFHLEENKMVCHFCQQKHNVANTCPNCHGSKIKYLGLGSEKIKKAINKILPQAKILEINLDTCPDRKKVLIDDYDFIIGTKFSFNKFNWDQIDNLAIINPDTLFHLHDYKANERAFQDIWQTISCFKNKTVYLQTFSPEHPLINYLKSTKPFEFYDKELTNRKNFKYPPFYKIIKLTIKNTDQAKTQAEALKIEKLLQENLNEKEEIITNPAAPSYRIKIRSFYIYNIIIRYSPVNVNALNQIFDFIDKNIPPDWIIDHEPENLD